MRRGRFVALSALLAAGAAATQPAQGTGTTLTVGSVSVTSTRLTVRGALTVGPEAFAPVVVSTDAAGDAGVSGAGLDLGNTTFEVTGYTTAPKVVVKMALHDGIAALDGNAPATGFSWPITVTDDSRTLFLGAGAAGTNFTPRTGSWVGLCTVTTGWNCGTSLPGGVSASAVQWELPFGNTVKPGAAIEAGGTYGGVPSSFAWPSVYILAGTAPADTASGSVGYRIPGGVEAAVTAEGDEEPFEFPFTASSNTKTGAYTVTVDHPGTTGPHTLWLRSCHGAVDAPVCVVKTHPVTL